jgi:hypothetical protein
MSDNEELEVDSEMAAAMGFSSFGAVPSTKRRKYNHNDAVVDASIAPNLSIRGSNALPLGQKRVPAQLPSMIASEDNAAEAVIEANENAAEAADVAGAQAPLPSKHSAATASVLNGWDVAKQGARQYSAAELAALREGVVTTNGHIAYFLPSFVEDPWKKVESRRVMNAS